ncbi:PLP-dependent aminotransferase family protein [Listeria rocourtiae]|uniref:aminotransferase-like domain-containing protein n=1 Tax=Listeria rocourtiae TaxID=647910 RepID=UPI003D2F76DE
MDIQINRHIDITLINQIFNQINNNIQQGILKEGTQLPSIRVFSQKYNISHVTVSKAYKKLENSGLINLIHGKGAFVKIKPDIDRNYNRESSFNPSSWQLSLKSYVDITHYTRTNSKDVRFNFSEAIINPKLLPSGYLVKKVNQILLTTPKIISNYSLAQGEVDIRESIRNYIAINGKFDVPISNMIITNGVQQGIDIVSKAFIGPDDIVITEESTYFHALEVFSNRGAKIITVPMDNHGLQINKLATLCSKYKPKLVYTIPTFHNPTGVTLSLARRKQLLSLAREHHFLIIEDDSWNDIYFDDMIPPPTIKSLDQEGSVIYLKGFSKYLSPGCRIGVIIANDTIYPHLLASKTLTDLGSPILTQKAVCSFLNTNRMSDHLIKLRTALEVRRNQILFLLQKHLPNSVQFTEPMGGLNFWLVLPKGADAIALLEDSLEKGISFLPGSFCFVNKTKSRHVRISFSYIDTTEISDGIIAFCKTVTSYLYRIE